MTREERLLAKIVEGRRRAMAQQRRRNIEWIKANLHLYLVPKGRPVDKSGGRAWA